MIYDADKLARIADDLASSSLWDMFKEDPSTRSLD